MTQPITEAKFGDLFAHADRLVQYMRDHPIITDAALLILQSLRHLNIGEDVDREPPGYIGFLNRYSLPCLQFAWQNHRAADLPDPMRDYRGEGREQDGDGPTVEFLEDAVDLPPFSWVDALGGRYLNLFGRGPQATLCVDFVASLAASYLGLVSDPTVQTRCFSTAPKRRSTQNTISSSPLIVLASIKPMM